MGLNIGPKPMILSFAIIYHPWCRNYFSRKTKQYKLFHSLQVRVLFQLLVSSFSSPLSGLQKDLQRVTLSTLERSILTIRPAYCQNPAYQTCFELPSTPVHPIHKTKKVRQHRKHRSKGSVKLEQQYRESVHPTL